MTDLGTVKNFVALDLKLRALEEEAKRVKGPHTRGGEPQLAYEADRHGVWSPHAWG